MKTVFKCPQCDKEYLLEKSDYRSRLKKSKRKKVFCSNRCSKIGRIYSQETKDKISKSQKGISVMSRGRKLTLETIEKIKKTKIGKPCVNDIKIVEQELSKHQFEKGVTTHGILPDGIFFRYGKIIALEIEKKRHRSDIVRKMDHYNNDKKYDEVIIAWYYPNGEFVKYFIKRNGVWEEYTDLDGIKIGVMV